MMTNAMPCRKVLAAGLLAGAFVLAPCPGRAGTLPEAQQQAYRGLRKDLIIALATTPGRSGTWRREHLTYLRGASALLKELPEGDNAYRAAVYTFRGRLLLHTRRPQHARKDFAAALACLGTADPPPEERPAGLPSVSTITILRALAFGTQDDTQSDGAIAAELDKLPEAGLKPDSFIVGPPLRQLAARLAETDAIDEAIRVYRCIQRFGLWEEDFQNPQRQIDLLLYRKKAATP